MLISCKKVFFTCFSIVWYWENKRSIHNASGLFHTLCMLSLPPHDMKRIISILYIYVSIFFFPRVYHLWLKIQLSIVVCIFCSLLLNGHWFQTSRESPGNMLKILPQVSIWNYTLISERTFTQRSVKLKPVCSQFCSSSNILTHSVLQLFSW